MKHLAVFTVLVVSLAACQRPEPIDFDKIAAQQCEPMRRHGELEYDRCVVEEARARRMMALQMLGQPSTSFSAPVGSGFATFK
jgi:hypothetical protein